MPLMTAAPVYEVVIVTPLKYNDKLLPIF